MSVARLLVFSLPLFSATLLLLACYLGTAKPQLVGALMAPGLSRYS